MPGADIAGKTGTAEFGGGDPPPTHAWFIGIGVTWPWPSWSRTAGSAARVAAPLAGQVLAGLPG